jgi:hypothetical protein
MWKKALSIVCVIVVLLVGTIASQVGKEASRAAFSPSQHTQQSHADLLLAGFTKAANQANARGSYMIDEDTRFDKAEAGPGARLTYFSSFPKYSPGEITSNLILQEVQPKVLKQVCGSEGMKPSLQYGATYVYVYTGNDGVEIARFGINKADCGY